MSTRFREVPLPDTGSLEADLIEAFAWRFTFGRRRAGRAWARLLAERHSSEVDAIIGKTVRERGREWRVMITRAISRGELPAGTDAALLLEMVRSVVDARLRGRLDAKWLRCVVSTLVTGAGRVRWSRRAVGGTHSTRTAIAPRDVSSCVVTQCGT
jgi:hypothetical protein